MVHSAQYATAPRRIVGWRWLAVAALALTLAACVTVTTEPRAVYLEEHQQVRVQRLNCKEAIERARHVAPGAKGLDPHGFRLLTWNIHKQGDKGWQDDLGAFTRADVLLLQELVLEPELRRIIESAGLKWAMASSFLNESIDIGVLTAARATPVATCTQRVVEPLLRLPKSSVITWYALDGSSQTLAIVNMHAINFSLSLGAYREQLFAMRDALAGHDGPIIFAGDLNTWTQARYDAVQSVAQSLGLTEIKYGKDKRTLFLGKQLDHIFVRGLSTVDSVAYEVTSSDHNPVEATLRLP